MDGGSGDDHLDDFESGADILRGGDGDDVFYLNSTEAGVDTVYGGAGADIFHFSGLSSGTAANRDKFFDFASGTDEFVISREAFGVAANGQFQVISQAATPAASATLSTVFYDTDNHALFFDLAGGGANFKRIADLVGNFPAALAASDFEFVA